jgi:pimeloyl-ACP methyl ester carboxylesterase
MDMTTQNLSLRVPDLGPVDVSVDDRGTGRAFLLLHGGGGPLTVASFAQLLSAHGRVITPTHPGFGGTARPAALATLRGVAAVYAALLEALDLREVTVIGNSLGGWLGAELALLAPARLARLVLVNAVGIELAGHPIPDVAKLSPPELAKLSFHDPSKLPRRPEPTDAEKAIIAGNFATMKQYAGATSGDPTLRARLADTKVPAVVLWGESDRIVDPTYGRAYADAFPQARFELLPETGHVPQIESPDLLLAAILR